MNLTSQAAAALSPEDALDSADQMVQPGAVEPSIDEADAGSERLRSTGEAAAELGLKAHVLRSWEARFEALSPMKRADGRRLYGPADMEVLRRLKNLLHVQGLSVHQTLRLLSGDTGSPNTEDAMADEGGGAPSQPEALGGGVMGGSSGTGTSVRDLQSAVHEAMVRGDFRAGEPSQSSPARMRLEVLLAELTDLKSRIDAVRGAA
jgi:DNA-binding transcriptional MerR regulator